jgi:2-keto-4-pentenoate hydratase/2-oxohepta-3-ene-1,7-dioic acid hydratase in catechol pathway
MRVLNLNGRLSLDRGNVAVDVETASGGLFAADVQGVYDRWDEFCAWAREYDGPADRSYTERDLGAPAPRPGAVYAIGLNYREHALEAGMQLPEQPMVFTKFPAAVTGPYDDIVLPSENVDWEVELVAVIGRPARHVAAADGWSYVAGLTAGQDISERVVQLSGPPPQQYNIGKSFEGFAPIGPALVTLDEFADPGDVGIACSLDGTQMQKARTGDLVFSIPELVAYLSSVLPLRPGDLIFTGTPSGIGWTRNPRRMIAPGEELLTYMDTIGEMRNRFVAR